MDILLERSGRVYLETAKEKEVYKALNSFIDSYNNVNAILEGPKFRNNNGLSDIASTFLLFKEGKYSVRPHTIPWIFKE